MFNFSEAVERMPFSKATNYFGAARKDTVDFSLGEPKDAPPESVVSAYIQSLKGGGNRYAPVRGIAELREKIAEKLRGQNYINAAPEEILVTGGASEAISFSILSLVNKGDEVIIIEPSYPIAASMVKFCGAKPVSLILEEKNNFCPDLEKLKQMITGKTKMLMINTPHNPTGSVFDKKTLRAISEIFPGIILADEVYENFTYGAKHHSLASVAARPENIITVNSFSKTYAMCGYRVGYLHTQKEIINQMLKLKLCISTCTANPCQRAALAALNDTEFPVMVKKRFEERRNLMVRGLKSLGLQFIEPKGAFYIFPNVAELGGDEKAYEFFLGAGVLTMPGRVFHEDCKNHVRFSFVADKCDIAEGIGRIDAAFKKLSLHSR
ncbi:MAG: aminotransferase class I/II-fold pyridoxal phosphate-dependent enzyme [Nanoarchaeota archaeon]|nr:aminotransferase class I/II-fold pyridoxal phosphate-dependent enzyme [Nanoarchaeota archaeon]MBU4299732.1 aminotransferase class I/II-fold pyridoxal phosphate-dependent enzyme [Nanoarchaeota archaeon]MBU4452546.1 aminotransferase class I/II-fold pyridoxal phosphate-dependent enzyme [Nanoarchaeota archaeon]MCG2723511.1 aminotransferase class I/II-fold pyridoxal phosphate-dependent enzyme [archaeon]